MWLKWLPWRLVVSGLARSHGFLDPLAVLANLRGFAAPSEVMEPLELLRAGVVMHARGLINTRAIQHNLDWVWPYWVERQFDPHDPSFVPRAFSLTHINLTHRNWTAVGVPGYELYPLVDPRGLVTPFFNGWSYDIWLSSSSEEELLPSRADSAFQQLQCEERLKVHTEVRGPDLAIESETWADTRADDLVCRTRLQVSTTRPALLVISVRPYNPEGISFIRAIAHTSDLRTLKVNGDQLLQLSHPAERVLYSTYRRGDVHRFLHRSDNMEDKSSVLCDVGLATAAAVFPLAAGARQTMEVSTLLAPVSRSSHVSVSASAPGGYCEALLHNSRYTELFRSSARVLELLAPNEVFAGPYTYRRFWFRDAAYILYALTVLGCDAPVRRAIKLFPKRQQLNGYFLSQEGEWDSNGEVLWLLYAVARMSGAEYDESERRMIARGAAWIDRKRGESRDVDAPHRGLLPAGFSAEHLGPNDYYYWDDYWAVAGLRAAAALLGEQRWSDSANELLAAIERSVTESAGMRHWHAVAASPYRRMDAGAIGSIVASYPLRITEPHDPRIAATTEFLLSHCLVRGAFFQDMIHSGMNAYLTLHLAQCLLRRGDHRAEALIAAVADLASPTGQWPEAIHPNTLGGCMGDGQHGWACAEWVMMIRNCFVREEHSRLIIGSGLWPCWLESAEQLRLGPVRTEFGTISIFLEAKADGQWLVSWEGKWRTPPEELVIGVPGRAVQRIAAPPPAGEVIVER